MKGHLKLTAAQADNIRQHHIELLAELATLRALARTCPCGEPIRWNSHTELCAYCYDAWLAEGAHDTIQTLGLQGAF